MVRLSKKFGFVVRLAGLFLLVGLSDLAFAQNECNQTAGSQPVRQTRDANNIVHDIYCQDPATGKIYTTTYFNSTGSAVSLPNLTGGVAPPGQSYNFAANGDPVTVPTCTPGDNSTNAASTACMQAAITQSQQAQVIAAHNYGVKADGKFRFDVTTTSGSNAISCLSNDCNFTAADDGKICFATNGSRFGQNNQNTSVLILPQGTFTHTGAQTGTCSGGNATSSTSVAAFVWGSDDTTPLANAWAAALAACATLQIPGVNPTADGPGVMLVQSASLNNNAALPNCFGGTGGSRSGIGVQGTSINSSYIVPTPNFDFTSCPTVSAVKSCFLSATDGINISHVNIFGIGLSNPAAGQSATSVVTVLPANNADVDHLTIMGWGSNTVNGIGFGLTFGGNDTHLSNVDVDGAGQTACHARPTTGAAANVMASDHLECWDTPIELLWVDGQSNATVAPFVSKGGDYGGTIGTSKCAIGITGGGFFTSVGDTIGYGFSEGNGICAGYAQGGAQTGNGFAVIDNDTIWLNASAGGSHVLVINNAGNYANISNTRFKGNVARSVLTPFTTGTWIRDEGGNVFATTGTPLLTGSGQLFGSASITGTLTASSNLVLTSGWGTANVNTIVAGSDARNTEFTISITGGVPAASPVLTYTFPTLNSYSFLQAPFCTLTQVGGTFAVLSNPVHVVTATTDTITFTGTAVNGQSYIFVESCH